MDVEKRRWKRRKKKEKVQLQLECEWYGKSGSASGRKVSRLDVSGELHEIGNKHAAKSPPTSSQSHSLHRPGGRRCSEKRG